ncbi:ExbD/TolR family protein [Leptolyngbya sp. AN02str]|uniref:ExbD/TolR family protein n=1 Tax=Leptolyngbya sp. AN02str TaxID=3423363 RepID=UPI003D318A9F
MALKNRRRSPMPEVDLVPMMDVLMTVLTFFIIISMTLRGQQVAGINLPSPEDSAGEMGSSLTAPTLVVGLNDQQQIVIENQPVLVAELAEAMQQHYSQHPDGVVLLKADKTLTYDQVANLLQTMRDIGGDRVSLAITP